MLELDTRSRNLSILCDLAIGKTLLHKNNAQNACKAITGKKSLTLSNLIMMYEHYYHKKTECRKVLLEKSYVVQ